MYWNVFSSHLRNTYRQVPFPSFKFSFKFYISVDLSTALKWDFIKFKVAVNVTFTDI